MTRKQYNFKTNSLTPVSDLDTDQIHADIESAVGASVSMQFRADPQRTPIVDVDVLPDGVSEQDVKQAIKKHHPLA